MAAAEVCAPPTTSTSGIRCGGLKGCPSTTRSGWRHSDCTALIASPEELDASKVAGGAAASMRRNRSILMSIRSGPFSCTKSASATASSSRSWKRSRSGDAPSASPKRVIVGQCCATASRRRASAPGEGSVASTSRPRARKYAVQLAPMTPVATTATRLMSDGVLLISVSRRVQRGANSGRGAPTLGRPMISRASAGVAGSMSISRMIRTMRSVSCRLVASSPWR